MLFRQPFNRQRLNPLRLALHFLVLSVVVSSVSYLGGSTVVATSAAKPLMLSEPSAIIKQQGKSVWVFISFSIPMDSLREWVMDANAIGATIVLRGLVNNSLPDTLKKVTELLGKDNQGGLQIDPRLFKTFGIEKVPAVVVVDAEEPCVIEETCHSEGTVDVVYGNVSLAYALQFIGKLN